MNEDRLLLYLTALLWDVGGMKEESNSEKKHIFKENNTNGNTHLHL